MKKNISTKILAAGFLFTLVFAFANIGFAQQITGLAGWNIYLDPGHGQFENMGIYNYSEAEKNLGVGLNLRQMLLDWTDIDTVYICRTNNVQNPSLTQRTDQANSLGAAHYHSIHSDAAAMGGTANSTLIMWGQMGIGGPEKTPHGGKQMSQIMIGLLTAGMRTTTRGAMGDRDFYQAAGSVPYLHVNRETNMASELSEAGFHTNPTQNQLNMNYYWKRMEAKTMFWTMLRYHNITRPYAGTSIGIISDFESGLPLNGAIVSLDGQVDTTDTYESLFYQYSNDPNFLRNGFYYFEGVAPGTHTLEVSAPGYDPISVNITMADTFFTFKDVSLISNTPPRIASTAPAENDSLYPGIENVVLNFTRQMNKASVEANLTINPPAAFTTAWSNLDQTLTINTNNFNFESQYSITIGGNAEGKFGHLFDGDSNGVGGDPFTLTINTKVADIIPPNITYVYPASGSTNVEYKPIINVAFSEALKTATISSRFKVIRNSTQTNVNGILRYYIVNGKGVLNFFITSPLVENETYTIKAQTGIEDLFGNPTTSDYEVQFTAGNSTYFQQILIDSYENGIANWWQPTASGSTVGVIPTGTAIQVSTAVLNASTGSSKSLQLNYAWDQSASSWLIREYFAPSAPTFGANTLLQVFLFGDGSNNQFRFAIKENSLNTFEVSPWYDIDWMGWKIVTWDLSQGQTGTWIGNNILEPPFSFDSFQMTYEAGNPSTGILYFDDLRTAIFSPTDVEDINGTTIPAEFVLEQNYPNPFNPSTTIGYKLPQSTNVTLKVFDVLGNEVATLVDEYKNAGSYNVQFTMNNLASGIYFYQLNAGSFMEVKKMLLIK